MRKIKFFLIVSIIFVISMVIPGICRAMPPGSLVYRTSSDGRMYGYSGDPLVYSEYGIVKNINSGHVGIYIGQENGVDYIVEALADGIVKTPADKFVNLAEGEVYLGAKIPKDLTAVQQAKAVAIAKSLAGKDLSYDFDFKVQKGPESGEWTCVGLTEKIYESADISNPNNLEALEYDPNYYALDITPDGYDNHSFANEYGDTFSQSVEFSKISRRTDIIIPAPEDEGYDVGLENGGNRYFFLPYTQFLQPSLEDVETDVVLASSFSGEEVRGSVPTAALVLRWSLINNPISSLKSTVNKVKAAVLAIKDRVFGNPAVSEIKVALDESLAAVKQKTASSSASGDSAKSKTIINKAADKSAASKPSSSSSSSAASKKTNTAAKTASTASNKTSADTKTGTDTKKTSADATSTNVKKASATTKKTATAKTAVDNNAETEDDAVVKAAYYSPAKAASASVDIPKIATINKIYGTGNNEWIELYNPTDQDFDLAAAGYRLEKAKTAVDPALIFRIGNTGDGSYPGGTVIKSHGYYRIVKSAASDYYRAQADAIATRESFTWPESGYTIYLGTGAISSNADPDIVEAVGFGSDATYFQGAGPASAITDNYILSRKQSTGNNSRDFILVKSDDPAIDWTAGNEEDDEENNNGATINTGNTDTTSTDDVATSTDNVATSTDNVATSTDELSDEYQELPLVISQIYSTGVNDFIKLYNPNDYDIDLAGSGYRLEKAKTVADATLIMRFGNARDGSYPHGTVIKPKDSYLIVRDDASEYFKAQADAIAKRSEFAWSGSGYTAYLAKGPVSSPADEDIVDMVGFGPDASYWQGNSPAPAIDDNYILNRTATTGQNGTDFDLIESDDPAIDWVIDDEEDGAAAVYSFSSSSYDLFSFPDPLETEDLDYLWHFDECTGGTAESSQGSADLTASPHWAPGKFLCAEEVGYENSKIVGNLAEAVDLESFSLSFWFRSTKESPRLSLTLANNDGDSINMTLEPGLMEFSGLPNPDWRYYGNFAFDSVWRQATLVINRDEGYWTLYVDGVEKITVNTYKKLPAMDMIEIAGNNGPFAIDELAIWNRAFSAEEVISLRDQETAFAPADLPETQARPGLKHFWNFDEGLGTVAADSAGKADLAVDKSDWRGFSLTDSIISIGGIDNLAVDFAALESPDLSMTLWWRDPDIELGGRARIVLENDKEENIFGMAPNLSFSGYRFDGINGYFNYGKNKDIPYDSNWHQLALVYDSYRNLLRFYVDGEEKGALPFVWPGDRTLPDRLRIKAENSEVEIDDLGIWEGALSPAQIKEIFANNKQEEPQ